MDSFHDGLDDFLVRIQEEFIEASGATSYQWVLPSGMYLNSGQGTRTISAYVTSWFSGGTVRVTANVGGCPASGTQSVTGRNCGNGDYSPKALTNSIDTATNARTALENTNDVVLYPNPPERGELNLQLQQVGNYRVEVRDSRGNLRYAREMKQLDKLTIDVTNYSIGLYLVTIFNGKDRTVKRLKIQ